MLCLLFHAEMREMRERGKLRRIAAASVILVARQLRDAKRCAHYFCESGCKTRKTFVILLLADEVRV